MTPSSGQDIPVNSGLPLLSLATHSQRGILGSLAGPARGPGCTPASREQQPFNQVSAYQWLIVARRQLRAKGRTKSCIPLHLPRLGPTGSTGPTDTASSQAHTPWAQQVFPRQASWLVGREGRKETHSSFLCSSLWAQQALPRSQVKFIHQR